MQRVNAVVVGCGISGLTCGVRLLEEGFQVTILAKLIPPNTTSDKAAAIWYPYRAYPEDKVLPWCKKTLDKFLKLSELPEAGVSFTEFHDVFGCEVSDPWWKEAVTSSDAYSLRNCPKGMLTDMLRKSL